MKYIQFLWLLGFVTVACEASKEQDPDPNPGTISLAELNAMIGNANAGDTVFLEPGVYLINGMINISPGITLMGKTSTKPIFDASAQDNGLFELRYTTAEVNNAAFSNIEFHNIKMRFSPDVDYDIKGIVFDNCLFDYGKRPEGTDEKSYLNDGYIVFIKTEDSAIRNCTFLRRNGYDGRGVINKYTKNTIIENNNWGGEDPNSTGYFITGINERGTNTIIRNNTIARHSSWNELAKQDHGIYALDFDGVEITNNTISGWQPNGSGGSIKARNGQNILIEDNVFKNSGILLYVYETSKIQQHLKNVLIKNNSIEIIDSDGTVSIYNGIGYWTDFTYENEYAIRVEGNTIVNGYCVAQTNRINVDGWNTNDGGFYDNSCIEINIKSGINHAENNAIVVEK